MFKSGKKLDESRGGRGGEDKAMDAAGKELNSIISEDMSIKGDVIFKGKIRVDGSIEGNITGDYLILGEKGRIKGDVSVQSFICNGNVEGGVKGEKVVFKSTAQVIGRVEAKELIVDSGAVIEGEFLVGRKKDTEVIEAPFEKEAAL